MAMPEITKSPIDESLFSDGGLFGDRGSFPRFLAPSLLSAQESFEALFPLGYVGGHGIAFTDGLALQIDILAKHGIPHHLLEKIKAIPSEETQRSIVSGLSLTSPRKVLRAGVDRMTEVKLKYLLSMFQRDPGVGYCSIVPTDGLELQIEKLAELGIPQHNLEIIKAIPNEAAKYFIVEDFLMDTPEVMFNAFDNWLTEFTLESVRRIFRSDPGVGGYVIAPTDDLALQIEKLAELGFPSRLVEMIKEIPDEATQRYLVNDFRTSMRNVMRNAFYEQIKLLVSRLRICVGIYAARGNGLADVRVHMPKEDNVPAGQVYTYVGEGTVRRYGLQDVCIDMPKEVIVPAEQKNPHLPGESVADIVKREGVAYLNNSPIIVPGPSWAKTAMEVAKLFGYASTALGHGTRNNKLSQFFIKAGAITTAASVIASLAMPLPAVVAWIVGPLALLIVAAAILFN